MILYKLTLYFDENKLGNMKRIFEHNDELLTKNEIEINRRSLEEVENEVNMLKELTHINVLIYKDGRIVE